MNDSTDQFVAASKDGCVQLANIAAVSEEGSYRTFAHASVHGIGGKTEHWSFSSR